MCIVNVQKRTRAGRARNGTLMNRVFAFLFALVLLVGQVPFASAQAAATDGAAQPAAQEQAVEGGEQAASEQDAPAPDDRDADPAKPEAPSPEQGSDATPADPADPAEPAVPAGSDAPAGDVELAGDADAQPAGGTDGEALAASAAATSSLLDLPALPKGPSVKVASAPVAGRLAAGTYTVSANISMMTPIGIVAYAANPANPLGIGGATGIPNTPASNNATLIVAEDGSATVTLPLVNPVFTIQRVGSASNATLTASQTKELEYVDDAYKQEVNAAGYSTRISSITVALGDQSGSYVFGGCAEYATALRSLPNFNFGVLSQDLTLTVDFSGVPGGALSYTGLEQTGVSGGTGCTLSGATSAVNAGDYTATAMLEGGYVWADGSTAPKTIEWTIAKTPLVASYAGETVEEGETPQLAVQVSGFVNNETAATAAGFVGPSIVAPAQMKAGESYELAPAGGAADNYAFEYRGGTLSVVAKGSHTPGALAPGTYRITANIFVPAANNDILHLTAYMTNPRNPLVPVDDPNYGIPTSPVADNATLVVTSDGAQTLVVPLPNPAFTLIGFGELTPGLTVLGAERDGKTYGTHTQGRLTKVAFKLDGTSKAYMLNRSSVYAAPLKLDKTWDLILAVEYDSAVKISDNTTVDVPVGPVVPGPVAPVPTDPAPAPAPVTPRPQGPSVSGKLAPGTYTVTANIWFDRATTGLPLNPHLTNSAFPPMNPVSDNATLRVESDGHAYVTVPIVIQARIMSVRSISGLNIASQSSSGDGISSITVDLGVLESSTSVVTKTCSVSVEIGSLAMSIGGAIFGGSTSHTWDATFQMNFSGVPTSGGGVIPANVAALMASGNLDAGDISGDATSAAAAEAIEAAKAANAMSRAANSSNAGVAGSLDVSGSDAEGADALPFAALAVVAVLAAGGTAAFLLLRRKANGTV